MSDSESDLSGPPLGESFVVWLDAGRPGEPQCGTVEHLGRATRERFADLAELPELILRALREPRDVAEVAMQSRYTMRSEK